MAKDVLEVLRYSEAHSIEACIQAVEAIAELIAAGERSKRSARLMHDDRQQEVVGVPPNEWRDLCAALAACRGL